MHEPSNIWDILTVKSEIQLTKELVVIYLKFRFYLTSRHHIDGLFSVFLHFLIVAQNSQEKPVEASDPISTSVNGLALHFFPLLSS